jgi:hypothetical protein
MKTTLSQKLLMLLALAGAGAGTAQAAVVNVGTTTGSNQAANATNAAITDGNLITTDQRWTRDNVYLLRRLIQVANGATLTIEPGTIIRGVNTTLSGITAEPGALLVSRGGTIIANGTADSPIVFTSIDDPNVSGGYATVPTTFTSVSGSATTILSAGVPQLANANYNPDGPEGNNGFSKAGLWGGVVVCGRGYVGQGTGSVDADADGIWDLHNSSFNDTLPAQNANIGADYPEGMSTNLLVPIYNPSTAIYGGLNDNDSSGVLRFVVIRYGGFVLGDPAIGNEINSLTLCGVGQGTVLEHIESYQNQDDGFEWFGGKNNSRYLFSTANQDDSFDGDEGYRGVNQFWTAIQGTMNTSDTGTTAVSLRSGWAGSNTRVGQVQRGSDYRYDNLFEWDGGEADNADRLPMTDFTVYNSTLLAGDTQKRGLQIRLEAHCDFFNGLVENIGTNGVSRATQSATLGSITSLLTWSNVHSFSPAVSGATEVGTVTASTVTVLNQLTPLVEETSSQIVSPWFEVANNCPLYQFQAFNPTLAAGANARTDDGVATPAGLVDAPFAGAMRDNNHMKGWTTLEALNVLQPTNVARPFLTIGLSGTNPTIGFTAVTGLRYVVEKSTDGKVWTLVQKAPVTGTGAVSVTDTTTTVGAAVTYRVFAL